MPIPIPTIPSKETLQGVLPVRVYFDRGIDHPLSSNDCSNPFFQSSIPLFCGLFLEQPLKPLPETGR